jgi:hypothetical protein
MFISIGTIILGLFIFNILGIIGEALDSDYNGGDSLDRSIDSFLDD